MLGDLIVKICISCESTCDIPVEMQKQFDIRIIPFTVLLGEKSGLDGDITPDKIFKYVDKTGILPKTSAVNEYQFQEYFENLKKEYDAIIHFSLSSGISSACENAKKVAALMEDVYIIDSKSLSTGIALQAIYARKLANKGLSPKEIVEKCLARVPFVQASFILDTVEYLYKGGRCSGLTRFAAALFRIKPQILVTDGKMHPGKKYRGKIGSLMEKYCADTLEEFNTPDLSIAFVTHTVADEQMVSAAKKALKEKGFKTIYETTAGATITSHCGPKTLGILYINDNLQED